MGIEFGQVSDVNELGGPAIGYLPVRRWAPDIRIGRRLQEIATLR